MSPAVRGQSAILADCPPGGPRRLFRKTVPQGESSRIRRGTGALRYTGDNANRARWLSLGDGSMAWEKFKQALLDEVRELIDRNSDQGHRADLHHLGAAFFSRFSAEDMRGRSAENLYGCLYGLLRFAGHWDGSAARVRFLNPNISSHGWESKATVLVALCRDMPFCTASVRGELNQRGIPIHTIASCNLRTRRDGEGQLLSVQPPGVEGEDLSRESLLFFEISRHSHLEDLAPLREAVEMMGAPMSNGLATPSRLCWL
jgi:NAD-specific glutamate dehydrogenase